MPLEPRAHAWVANSMGDTLKRMRERRGVRLPPNLHPRHAHDLSLHAVHYAPDAAHPLYDRTSRPVCPALFLDTSMVAHAEVAKPTAGGASIMERLAMAGDGGSGARARSRASSRAAAAATAAASRSGSRDESSSSAAAAAALVLPSSASSRAGSRSGSLAPSAAGSGTGSRAGSLSGGAVALTTVAAPAAAPAAAAAAPSRQLIAARGGAAASTPRGDDIVHTRVMSRMSLEKRRLLGHFGAAGRKEVLRGEGWRRFGHMKKEEGDQAAGTPAEMRVISGTKESMKLLVSQRPFELERGEDGHAKGWSPDVPEEGDEMAEAGEGAGGKKGKKGKKGAKKGGKKKKAGGTKKKGAKGKKKK